MKANTKKSLVQDTEGLSFVEYLIVLCVVALLGFAAWKTFGQVVTREVMLSGAKSATIQDVSTVE